MDSELELIMTGKNPIPCIVNCKKRKIKENCYELTTPFLDSNNDYITIYLTFIDKKLVLVDEDTIPDFIRYSSENIKTIIKEYISENAPLGCYLENTEKLVYELNQKQDIAALALSLDVAYPLFLSFILEVLGLAKYFKSKNI